MDALEAAVTAEDTVIDSVIVLLGTLSQMVKDAGTDPARLAAVVAGINAKKQALADAVVANTPAAP